MQKRVIFCSICALFIGIFASGSFSSGQEAQAGGDANEAAANPTLPPFDFKRLDGLTDDQARQILYEYKDRCTPEQWDAFVKKYQKKSVQPTTTYALPESKSAYEDIQAEVANLQAFLNRGDPKTQLDREYQSRVLYEREHPDKVDKFSRVYHAVDNLSFKMDPSKTDLWYSQQLNSPDFQRRCFDYRAAQDRLFALKQQLYELESLRDSARQNSATSQEPTVSALERSAAYQKYLAIPPSEHKRKLIKLDVAAGLVKPEDEDLLFNSFDR